jgi:hypothetical protein
MLMHGPFTLEQHRAVRRAALRAYAPISRSVPLGCEALIADARARCFADAERDARLMTLKPGESVDMPNGTVARTYSGSMSYYAEHLDKHGEAIAISPNFPTFDAAVKWLETRS